MLPYCPGCGAKVFPVNPKAVLGFREASERLLLRIKKEKCSPLDPHFSHYHNEGEGCPYSAKEDAFFAPLKHNRFDHRDELNVYAILLKQSEFNGKVFDALYRTISHGGTLSKDQKKELWEHTKTKMCRMSLLMHEPWVYPFAQILLMGPIH
ncbi:MAG: hypothetical protein EOM37_03115 [Proteobacteria bacterium]|nr:hypothetical protein [Pseudomonadota bacterium]